jgi:DNA-binding beta-propeller fold protein YncE
MVLMNRREFIAVAATAPFVVRTLAANAAASPLALVTCDAESRLAVVDLATFRILRSISTLPDPRSVERVGTRAVVCHTAVGAVSIVGPRGVEHVFRDFAEPRYTAAHPDGRHAFVTDSGRSGVVAIDVVRGTELGRVNLPGWARHLTIDAAGRHLWVGLGSASAHVAAIDIPALHRRSTVTPGFGAHDVGMGPDGQLWITAGDAPSLAVGRVVQEADAAPQHVTFGDAVAYVTSGATGVLRVLALDGRLVRTTSVPVGSYNVQYGFGRVLTASLSHGTLTVLDRGGVELARLQVAGSCHDACFLPR